MPTMQELYELAVAEDLLRNPPSTKEEIMANRIQLAIDFFEEQLNPPASYPPDTIASHPDYRLSYETLLRMLKNGEIDGSKDVYVHKGKVLDVKDGDKLPPYTYCCCRFDEDPETGPQMLRATASGCRENSDF